jgi:photosystem II stability/assembly factor-like uncharacterized protein
VTVIAPPRPPQSGETEALIEEARRRARRRRRWYGVCLLLVSLGVGLYFAVGRGGGSGGRAPTSARPGRQPPSQAEQRQQIARVGARYVVGEAGLVGPGLGWAMNGLGLWWTRDAGAHWRAIAPPPVAATGDVVARVVDIAAVDDDHIWVAAADIQGSKVVHGSTRHMAIERTTDGGRTWKSVVPPGCYGCGGAHLSFLDVRQGFALVGDQPRPRLYETSDGGAGWRLVPSDVSFTGPIGFVSAEDGWAVSEPGRIVGPAQSVPVGGGIVYRTRDGGRHWRRVSLSAPPRYSGQAATAGVPRFFGAREGVVPVRFRDRSRAQHLVLYVTDDGGGSWSARPAPVVADLHAESWGFPEAVPFSAATAEDWFLFAGSKLYTTHDGGWTWTPIETVAPPVPRVWDVDFTSPRDGWAIFATTAGMALVQTHDGGRNWTALAPR